MIIQQAIEVLEIEARGILDLIGRIDEKFSRMVELIHTSRGRLIVSGIGKSGIVARKIVATLNSTGTRSFFLHPVEAMHGDLGQVSPDDIFLALSNSGETEEINFLIPSIRTIGCRVIAFTGDTHSTLAKHSDIVIDVGVEKEACPMGLAPTASTTALMAVGDALAVVLINKKQFNASDFKRFHPSGNLGRHLASRVRDIMISGDAVPLVTEGTPITEAIRVVDRYKLGHALVISSAERLTGIIADGDIRRMLVVGMDTKTTRVEEVMTRNPRKLSPETPAYNALNLMEQHQITALPIVDPNGRVKGIVHLHDLLGKGSFKFNGT
jgi:arabinose-5-phosphate isomerase